MKKIIVTSILFVLVLQLVACNASSNEETTVAQATVAPTEEVQPTDTPEPPTATPEPSNPR